MSDNSPFGFGRFVPGFDFLQSLAQGAAAGMPGLPGWVAPTASVQEIDKRIQELKVVQFWLDQNARALAATVQALEVQKMTLATLQGMNVAMGDMAAAFGGLAGGAPSPAAPAPAPQAAPAAAPAAASAAFAAAPTPASAPPAGAGTPAGEGGPQGADAAGAGSRSGAAAVDPLQWWGALTQQFQQIAARAVQDAASHQAAFDATRDMASGALKTANDMAAQWTQAGAAAAAPAPAPQPRARRAAPGGDAPPPAPAAAGARRKPK